MRIFLAFAALVLAAFASVQAVQAAGPGCMAFDGESLTGRSLNLEPGANFPALGRRWNDRISSAQCARGCVMAVFTDENFAGRSGRVEGRADSLGRRFNDRISSLKVACRAEEPEEPAQPNVRPDSCNIYEHSRFRGRAMRLSDGDEAGRLSALGDKVSSAACARNCTITLFDREDFRGRSQDFTRETPYVGDEWNDRASSAQVFCGRRDEPRPEPVEPDVRPGTCMLYEHNDFRGGSIRLSSGDRAERLRGFNDLASSVACASTCSITLYEDDGFRGRSQEFKRQVPSVGRDWNDRASSAEVYCSGKPAPRPEPEPRPEPAPDAPLSGTFGYICQQADTGLSAKFVVTYQPEQHRAFLTSGPGTANDELREVRRNLYRAGVAELNSEGRETVIAWRNLGGAVWICNRAR